MLLPPVSRVLDFGSDTEDSPGDFRSRLQQVITMHNQRMGYTSNDEQEEKEDDEVIEVRKSKRKYQGKNKLSPKGVMKRPRMRLNIKKTIL